jgi:hypothetical protein
LTSIARCPELTDPQSRSLDLGCGAATAGAGFEPAVKACLRLLRGPGRRGDLPRASGAGAAQVRPVDASVTHTPMFANSSEATAIRPEGIAQAARARRLCAVAASLDATARS